MEQCKRDKDFNKKKAQTIQQIFHNLGEIVELYPQYSVANHLAAILRKKNSIGQDFFHWSDTDLLKKIEQHKDELEGEDIMNDIETED